MCIEESSLEASSRRPDRDTPTLVKLEFGVGGLYWYTSWSPLISHSLTYRNNNKKGSDTGATYSLVLATGDEGEA